MAGRLPGVGLPPRKRSEHHHNNRYEYHATHRDAYLRDKYSLESPWLDETALKARQRLQKKLAHFFSYSRSSESSNPIKEGKVSEIRRLEKKKESGLGRKILESSWLLRGNKFKFKKERKVCAVCLEDFEEDQEVMNLSCSHKYHSACLLPWLASHPHCPYCRTLVHC